MSAVTSSSPVSSAGLAPASTSTSTAASGTGTAAVTGSNVDRSAQTQYYLSFLHPIEVIQFYIANVI